MPDGRDPEMIRKIAEVGEFLAQTLSDAPETPAWIWEMIAAQRRAQEQIEAVLAVNRFSLHPGDTVVTEMRARVERAEMILREILHSEVNIERKAELLLRLGEPVRTEPEPASQAPPRNPSG